jgi:hypothetical protein
MRCGRLTATTPYGAGLWLCAACPPALTPCAEFAHDYRAWDGHGRWICLQCGTALLSQPISPMADVPAQPGTVETPQT